ncbi:MAG: MerR family transcriptional regulator [Anaerolineaceae bacterium]|nr:MerR family transcriptional regulator [Anaerolineaceae bacterium]
MIELQEETFTIQEVAEMTDLSAHTLRYYEKIGLLEHVTRHENGHRRYAEQDLGWIHFLKLLRATGMPIQQMQVFMEFARQGDSTIPDRVEVLTEHRRSLAQHIAELQDHLAHLDRKIAFYNGILTGEPAEPCD